MDKDYREKIRKLLALAESPNEYEAKAALLKARELMAEHKLSESELKEIGKKEVRDIHSGVTCSKRRDPWAIDLGTVISEHYCCRGFRSHRKGKQTQEMCFVGLEDDVEIYVEIYKYAVDCIRAGIERVKRNCPEWLPDKYVKMKTNGYGYGFVWGIYDALEAQEEEKSEEGWGLVLSCPQEVNDYIDANRTSQPFKVKARNELDVGCYNKGLKDGKEWDPGKRITAV